MLKKLLDSNFLMILFLVGVVALLVYIFAFGQPYSQTVDKGRMAKVAKVIDGDTVELENGTRVRYIGIDTPEKGDPYSVRATDYNEDLVYSKEVWLEYGVERYDHYNRLLAYVWVNSEMVNLKLVKEGLARSYPVEPNTSYQYEFEMAEFEAKQARKNIWSSLSWLFNLDLITNL